MDWYTWTTVEAFNQWHATVVAGLNLPRIGRNAATGELEPQKQQTTAYTTVSEVSPTDWRAPVAADIAAVYPDGLGTPCDPPPTPDF